MSETSLITLNKILAFAAIVEVGTGVVMVINPSILIALLLGVDVSLSGTLLGRFFGIVLLALGLACWPDGLRAASNSPAFRAMLSYNTLIALYLAYLAMLGQLGGLLLWPAVALHIVVALLLVWTWRIERPTKAHSR